MIGLLVESASRSLVLGGIVGLVLFLFRVRNPHLLKTAWMVVLLACLAMPFALEWRVAPSFDAPTYLLTLTGHASEGAALQSSFATLGSEFARSLLAIGYGAVALALLVRFAVGLVGVWRIRRTATPSAEVGVRLSSRVKSPATFGSTILLPANAAEWSAEKLRAVLAHERAHVRHRDSYLQWLSCLHTCVFWFNPLAWWLNRRLADLAETTSDDAVLHAMPDRTAYASLLLDVARQAAGAAPAGASVVMSAAQSNVSARIERIISDTPPSQPLARRVHVFAAVALMPLLVMGAATLRPSTAERGPMESTPKISNYGSLTELQKFYPKEAMRAGVETLINVRLTIDASGTVTAAEAIDPTPSDNQWGFTDAAVAVAKTIQYENSAGTPRQTNLKVKFALDR